MIEVVGELLTGNKKNPSFIEGLTVSGAESTRIELVHPS